LILIDIDHFKRVNDTYGHAMGDMVLKEVSKIMQKCIRGIDTAARYGGEEFTIVLPNTPKEDAVIVAEESEHPWKITYSRTWRT